MGNAITPAVLAGVILRDAGQAWADEPLPGLGGRSLAAHMAQTLAELGVREHAPGAPGAAGVLLWPVRHGLVRAWSLGRLVQGFAERPDEVVCVTCSGERGWPVVVPAELASGETKRLLRGPVCEVEVADEGVVIALDGPPSPAQIARLELPSKRESELLMERVYGAGERGLAHGRGVARAALAMARELRKRDADLDDDLIRAAGLLHDVAKGRPHHEAAGAELLASHGFPRVAAIVGAHRDLELPEDQPIGERELVYLADKVVAGPFAVTIEARFQAKLDAFVHDPEAYAAISGRRSRALALKARLERETGQNLYELLAREGLHVRDVAPDHTHTPWSD